MSNYSLKEIPTVNDYTLRLSPIKINEDYCKKWNVHCEDFVLLTRNGKPIREVLYRVGGIGSADDLKKDYFTLLKHVEAYYEDSIVKKERGIAEKRHLESRWCILDKNGNEKVVFEPFQSPYLISDSCIYTVGNHYYNIETRNFYCQSFTRMTSTSFIFLENAYDKDESKRGIMKINKKDGTFELIT